MKNRRCFCAGLLVFLTFFLRDTALFAQNLTYTRETDGLFSYVLENGLEVYILESLQSPVSQVLYTCKAGFSTQTPATTGIPELYSHLFFEAGPQGLDAFTKCGASGLAATVFADSAQYRLECPESNLNVSLAALAACAINPQLSNAEIQAAFSTLLSEKSAWAASPAGFINSALDSRIFSAAPWKYDTGIFPERFSQTTPEELRASLSALAEKYYTPNNSALFIATSLPKEQVLAAVQKLFGSWKRGAWNGALGDAGFVSAGTVPRDSSHNGTRFALVSDSFSKDFTQCIIQFAGGSGDTSIEALAAWQSASLVLFESRDFAAAVCDAKTTGVSHPDFYNVAFTQSSSVPRLIFQALAENTGSGANPVQAAAALTATLTAPDWYTQELVSYAAAKTESQAVSARTGSERLIDALAQNWAYGGTSYFYDFPAVSAALSVEAVRSATKREPSVFLLVHPDIYKKHQKAFEGADYETVTEKNGPWYMQERFHTEIARALGKTTDNENGAESGTDWLARNIGGTTSGTTGAKQQSAFVAAAEETLSSATLKNGIPLMLKAEPRSSGVTFRFTIFGGDLRHTAEKKGLEGAIITAVAENIRRNISRFSFDATVSCDTDLWKSNVTITTAAPYAKNTLEAVARALFYEDIRASQADEIRYNAQYEWRVTSGDLHYQYYSAAMETLFRNQAESARFAYRDIILEKISFGELTRAYTALLDPSRYLITVVADNPALYTADLERVFGSICQFTGSGTEPSAETGLGAESKANAEPVFPRPPSPRFVNATKPITLHRIFTTDIAAEDAEPRPLHLVPTTVFNDPVHYYFTAPPYATEDYALYLALMLELETELNKAWPAGVAVTVYPFKTPVVGVAFSSVPPDKDIFPLFARCFNRLQDDKTANDLLRIKSRAITRLFAPPKGRTSGAFTVEQLEAGLLYAGDPLMYTKHYAALERATNEDFDRSLNVLRPSFPILQLISADRKK